MPSLQAHIVKKLLLIKPFGWARGSIEEQRSRQEKAANRFRTPRGMEFEPIHFNGMKGAWVNGPDFKDGVVLYLHGGAFVLGSIDIHRDFLGRFALATRTRVLAIDYRLAPEHLFPAALEDSLCAYDWLLSQGFDSRRIVIAGDSAGGGLALSTLVALRDRGGPLPACVVCISPWVDLTFSSPSVFSKAKADPVLSSGILTPYANDYAGEHPKDDPLISPLYANFEGLPPLLIHVGTDEIFLDEARLLTTKAGAAGVDVKLQTWEGMFHVFQMVPFLPESRESLGLIAAFISQNIQADI